MASSLSQSQSQQYIMPGYSPPSYVVPSLSYWNPWLRQRAHAFINQRRGLSTTYTEPLLLGRGHNSQRGATTTTTTSATTTTAEMQAFLKEFYATIYTQDRRELYRRVRMQYPAVNTHYRALVTNDATMIPIVTMEDFWQRYEWRCGTGALARVMAELAHQDKQKAEAAAKALRDEKEKEEARKLLQGQQRAAAASASATAEDAPTAKTSLDQKLEQFFQRDQEKKQKDAAAFQRRVAKLVEKVDAATAAVTSKDNVAKASTAVVTKLDQIAKQTTTTANMNTATTTATSTTTNSDGGSDTTTTTIDKTQHQQQHASSSMEIMAVLDEFESTLEFDIAEKSSTTTTKTTTNYKAINHRRRGIGSKTTNITSPCGSILLVLWAATSIMWIQWLVEVVVIQRQYPHVVLVDASRNVLCSPVRPGWYLNAAAANAVPTSAVNVYDDDGMDMDTTSVKNKMKKTKNNSNKKNKKQNHGELKVVSYAPWWLSWANAPIQQRVFNTLCGQDRTRIKWRIKSQRIKKTKQRRLYLQLLSDVSSSGTGSGSSGNKDNDGHDDDDDDDDNDDDYSIRRSSRSSRTKVSRSRHHRHRTLYKTRKCDTPIRSVRVSWDTTTIELTGYNDVVTTMQAPWASISSSSSTPSAASSANGNIKAISSTSWWSSTRKDEL